MNSEINFKELWSQQQTALPDTTNIYKLATLYKKKKLYHLLLSNVLFLSISIFIGLGWIYFQPQLLSTKIGTSFIILSMLFYIGINNTLLPLLTKENDNLSNNEYLKNLLSIKKKRLFLQTTVLNLYYLCISTGIGLYMYEYAIQLELKWFVTIYLITLLWIGINWIYLRPKAIKKQQQDTTNVIEQFQKINSQIKP